MAVRTAVGVGDGGVIACYTAVEGVAEDGDIQAGFVVGD